MDGYKKNNKRINKENIEARAVVFKLLSCVLIAGKGGALSG
jgi:hypothetical protein